MSPHQNPREDLPGFVKDFLLNKYGLPSICDGYLYAVVDSIMKHGKTRPRLRYFGLLLGVYDTER